MGSGSFRISSQEFKRWLHNAFIFLAPALLLFLMKIQSGGSVQDAFLALEMWALNAVVDFLRKYVPDTQ